MPLWLGPKMLWHPFRSRLLCWAICSMISAVKSLSLNGLITITWSWDIVTSTQKYCGVRSEEVLWHPLRSRPLCWAVCLMTFCSEVFSLKRSDSEIACQLLCALHPVFAVLPLFGMLNLSSVPDPSVLQVWTALWCGIRTHSYLSKRAPQL